MVGYWISFALIFILIPVGMVHLKNWALKDKELTEKQKTYSNEVIIKYTLFYWLCDMFYMSCFIKNLICQFTFGGLIMIIIMMSVSSSIATPKIKNSFDKWGILHDFIIGVGISIYLVYLIPNTILQTIVITIVSAIYGGLITLVGVAWTIRKADDDRKNDEINKARPLFSFSNIIDEKSIKESKHFCYSSNNDITNFLTNIGIIIENSNNSTLQMKCVYHGGYRFELKGNNIVLPSNYCYVSICANVTEKDFVILEVSDCLNNIFYYKIDIKNYSSDSNPDLYNKRKFFYVASDIKEISSIEKESLIKKMRKYEIKEE